jgi:hypothetical protein
MQAKKSVSRDCGCFRAQYGDILGDKGKGDISRELGGSSILGQSAIAVVTLSSVYVLRWTLAAIIPLRSVMTTNTP